MSNLSGGVRTLLGACEKVEELQKDCQKARDLIDRLLDALNALPCCWEDFVGEELADEVKDFLGWEDEEDEDEDW